MHNLIISLVTQEEEATYLLGKISFRNEVDLPKYHEIRKPQDDDYNIIDIFRLNESRECSFIKLDFDSFTNM